MNDRSRYAGMTVNERLFVSGKLSRFDFAIRRGWRWWAIRILRSVDLETPERTVDVILSDPTRYGIKKPPLRRYGDRF
jgi:hypothetical protein